jgi:hypothetical protein
MPFMSLPSHIGLVGIGCHAQPVAATPGTSALACKQHKACGWVQAQLAARPATSPDDEWSKHRTLRVNSV